MRSLANHASRLAQPTAEFKRQEYAMPMQKILIVIVSLTLASCAAPINRHNAEKYYFAAVGAQQSGDWWNSRMYFGRAITNAELGSASDKSLALLWYEYGRSSGVICDWEEAERGLNEALKLDLATRGPAYMTLYELARMSTHRKMYPEAADYFQRAYNKMEEDQADTKDPIGYADFLNEYTSVLRKTGETDAIPDLNARADKIRAAFEGKESHTETTPYGSQCQAGS